MKTSSSKSAATLPPGASALDGVGEVIRPGYLSPALSTASTADGDDGDDNDDQGIESSPGLPSLPAPKLPERASAILKGSPTREESPFGTASWGSPYPRSDDNLRRQSFSSDLSDDSPIHQLDIDTPFLRPPPDLEAGEEDQGPDPKASLSAAAAVLANRVRRRNRGLTEDWIRAHTAGDANAEPKHWFSEGSDSEHSSLSGSDLAWLDERDPRTPRAIDAIKAASRRQSRHPRGRSSLETLKPVFPSNLKTGNQVSMSATEAEPTASVVSNEIPINGARQGEAAESAVSPELKSSVAATTDGPSKSPAEASSKISTETDADIAAAVPVPTTPTKLAQKPLPEEPPITPRIKKKVPWKGKNILILLPRDDQRGRPGKTPMPLGAEEMERMFNSWRELGYSVDGFDLLVEGYQAPGTDDSQSRLAWPSAEDLARERASGQYKVTLPDLNAWKDYVNELQEAKLRALGVSFAEDEPAPSVSPSITDASRQASAQYPPLPFSPPIPTSSASSNHQLASFPFTNQFIPGSISTSQSPSIASPVSFGAVPGKFNPRQSISLPAGNSPFQLAQQQGAGWHNQANLLQGLARMESPSLMNLNGMISPQSAYGIDGLDQTVSPGMNIHQRRQSLQFMPPHQFGVTSPPLADVREEEDDELAKSPSKTPEPPAQSKPTQMEGAEYHLEEQLRNQLEHEDYNPQSQADTTNHNHETLASVHERQASGNLTISEHFANDPSKPVTLHHPRPHSRGQSITQNFFRDHNTPSKTNEDGASRLNNIPEAAKTDADEAEEIQTNPSNLGTPVQDFDFASVLAPPQRATSTGSNPWNENGSAGNGGRRSGQANTSSGFKLNVKAPEFKFDPTSNFTPGLFNFTGSNFQTGSFQPGVQDNTHDDTMDTFDNSVVGTFDTTLQSSPPEDSIAQFGNFNNFTASASSFNPGKSEFNFSSSGPKFNPDAPSFTPFQSLSNSVNSETATSAGMHPRRTDSIFGNINISAHDIVKPAKKSKAIPIMRPSSITPDHSGKDESGDDELQEDANGRLTNDSRAKRAKSIAPTSSELPLFASITEESIRGDDEHLDMDTSVSSNVLSQQIDTKQTTAAPSESSPSGHRELFWKSLEKNMKTPVLSRNNSTDHGHRRSLSATAPVFTPGAVSYGVATPTSKTAQHTPAASIKEVPAAEESSDAPASKATAPSATLKSPQMSPRPAKSKPKGLAASRYASAADPEPEPAPRPESEPTELEKTGPEAHPDLEPDVGDATDALASAGEVVLQSVEEPDLMEFASEPPTQPDAAPEVAAGEEAEPTFEEIDAIMQQLESNPAVGVKKSIRSSMWAKPTESPVVPSTDSIPEQGAMQAVPVAEDRSSQQPTQSIPPTADLEDPFVDPPVRQLTNEFEMPPPASEAASDWENTFSDDEHSKLENRTQFFDGRVNEVVGDLLASRLEPLEKAIFSIQQAVGPKSRRAPSSRRELRSVSGEAQESDADDEDDEPVYHRSTSPRKDRRMEHIRAAVLDAMSSHTGNMEVAQAAVGQSAPFDNSSLLHALDEMKEQLIITMKSSIIANSGLSHEDAEKQLASMAQSDDEFVKKLDEFQNKISDLDQRLFYEQTKVEKETTARRAAEDASAEMERKLKAAEDRIEVEVMNRSVVDRRAADHEERSRQQEEKVEAEIQLRRAAEERLSEVQRQLRISSEEETRLREALEEKDARIREIEQQSGKKAMRMTLLEAAQNNATQSKSEFVNKMNALEGDLREVRQDNNHWRSEAERSDEAARRAQGELAHALEENKQIQKSLDTVTTHLEENERLRENWRLKFQALQEDMAHASREVAEESARRIKKEQAMIARQEVLDARLQAEAKTRERLEVEMERLQENERSGMRAINECKRLEGLLGELRTENFKLQTSVSKHQREFDEARETGASEVKRTRMTLQTELEAANNQVNVIRQELEDQVGKLRAELDGARLENDASKEQHEMLLEEARAKKDSEIEELKQKHSSVLEDIQAQHDRVTSNNAEDSQRSERDLLERLNLSHAKAEHLQERIVLLEDKLEVAKEAAAAAAQAAKASGVELSAAAAPASIAKPAKLDLPEKISPQALRESIMVLQEQLQAREQRIEELEQAVANTDPDAPAKISKRDDEISWLRELLAVRHGDLQDIITALSTDSIDRERVKDAAIRLKANLQMEEQERERAMNGGSAITLPNIAQSIQAATPRVAQTIGSGLNAWDRWRKSSQPSFLSNVLTSPSGPANSTPSRSKSSSTSQTNLLEGLLTPPASNARRLADSDRPQPTAFASTGRRFPSHGSVTQRRSLSESSSSAPLAEDDKAAGQEMPPNELEEPEGPATPPMAGDSAYDSDAQPGDFDEHDFFED